MENGFGCCSQWGKCATYGYCFYRDYTPPGKPKKPTNVFRCALGRDMFVDPVEGVREKWKESAKRNFEERGEVPEENLELKEVFDMQLAEYRSRGTTKQTTTSEGQAFSIAGIKLRNGVLVMPKYKVIDQRDGLELVSWLYKDIMHYGIQAVEGEMLELFTPTKSLRGQALRAYAIQAFNSKVEEDFVGKWPIVATCVSEIAEGQVIVYESQPGTVMFALVTKVMPSLIVSVTNIGTEALWLPTAVDSKILQQKIQVIDREYVPARFNTFPYEMKI